MIINSQPSEQILSLKYVTTPIVGMYNGLTIVRGKLVHQFLSEKNGRALILKCEDLDKKLSKFKFGDILKVRFAGLYRTRKGFAGYLAKVEQCDQ